MDVSTLPILPPVKDRIKGQYYNYKGEYRLWNGACLINRDKIRASNKKYRQSDKGIIYQSKESQKRYDKDMGTVEGKRRRDIDRMHSKIKERCKNRYGLIGKTRYHIEGYGWVHPPINGDENWRWDGVTRKN